MTFSEVKKFIYELVKRYHPGAMVVWTKTKGVTPKGLHETACHPYD